MAGTEIKVTSVKISQTSLSLYTKDSFTLTATVLPTNATNKSLIWYSSDANVATVHSGFVFAKSEGTAILYAASTDGSGVQAQCRIMVTDIKVSSISLSETNKTMRKGENDMIYATVYPQNAANTCVLWESNNTSVVTANEETGFIRAVGTGYATVTARATDGSGKSASCSIYVNSQIHVQDISLSKSEITLKVGEQFNDLCANVYPLDATNKDVRWISCNPDVAKVFFDGEVVAISPGVTEIVAITSDGNYTASCKVKVVIDDVTLEYHEGTTLITFNSSGKQWKCVREDMVFTDENSLKQYLLNRANFNLYVHPEPNPSAGNLIISEKRTYSNDEIKLLYAIDPYGVSCYIKTYAEDEYSNLEDRINYKDDIFRLLFNRNPKYFKRKNESEWEITTDTSNISEIISESETIFGMHAIWDDITTAQLWELGVRVIEFAVELYLAVKFPSMALKYKILYNTVENLVKAGVLVFTGVNTMDLFDLVQGELSAKTFEDTGLEWANDIVSFYGSLYDIISLKISNRPNLNGQIIKHCANDSQYAVYIKMANGNIYNLRDASNIIEQL